jgi:hypothetical protein
VARKIKWRDEPEGDDYDAARTYLRLTFPPKQAKALAKALERADIERFEAKDIFRASGLSLLGVSNSHVERDLRRIKAGRPLSPLLLVRMPDLARVVVADGYHRLCAVYSLDEDAVVPCKIV